MLDRRRKAQSEKKKKMEEAVQAALELFEEPKNTD